MQDRVKTLISGIIRNQKVAHAYLFLGGLPEGKLAAAQAFARALNCASPTPPCHACPSCKKAETGVHPDIITIEKDEASLKIEQVRQLKDLTRYGPSEGRFQVVIINEAETLTPDAANSFLKVLEEPPARVVFILISNREEALPPTILSRCQKIIFPEAELAIPEESRKVYELIRRRPFDYIQVTKELLAMAEAKNLESALTGLFSIYAKAKEYKRARSVLETLRGIKKRGNQKLAADHLGLRLWKEN